jgi:hypothetical protein
MKWRDEEIVSIGGRFYRFGELMSYMDQSILYEASEFAGYGATMQAVVDLYLELFARRHCGVSSAA